MSTVPRIILITVLVFCALNVRAEQSRLLEPLPLDLVSGGMNEIDWYSGPRFSPDGQWLVYVERSGEAEPMDLQNAYSKTGVPGAYGAPTHVMVMNHATRATIRLGGLNSWSWGAKWSPDGRHLAFFSDEGGSTRLWLWSVGSRTAKPLGNLIVRPTERMETPEWSPDSRHLLLKVLPKGTTLETQNALSDQPLPSPVQPEIPFKPVAEDQPSVYVLRTGDAEHPPPRRRYYKANSQSAACDLVIIDLHGGILTTIASSEQVRWAEYASSGQFVAYSRYRDTDDAEGFGKQDVMVYDLNSKAIRSLATELPLYPSNCVWSPDSTNIACVTIRFAGSSFTAYTNQLLVFEVRTGRSQTLAENVQMFGGYTGGVLWNQTSSELLLVGTDEPPNPSITWWYNKRDRIWRAPLGTRIAEVAFDIPGKQIINIISDGVSPWRLRGQEDRTWFFARQLGTQQGRVSDTILYSADLSSGAAKSHFHANTSAWSAVSADSRSGSVAYVATTLQSPVEVWARNVLTGKTTQLTHLNPRWDRYALGVGTTLHYQDLDGRPLRAGLLLPPGYRRDRKLPLVVFTFGYANDSSNINSFGIFGSASSYNMHVWSTYGYAVLHPDMPLRTGTQLKDVLHTVMPAVNAAIDQGYVDSERMGVVGYSIGSYTALALALQTERFKAVTTGGITVTPDLYSSYLFADPLSGNPNSYDDSSYGLAMKANPWEHPERFYDNSLSVHFNKLKTPLLMAQGTGDGLFVSHVIFGGLKRLRKDVEYRVYEHEDHSVSRAPNAIDLWRRRLQFFDEKLDITRTPNGQIVFENGRPKATR